MTIRTHVPVSRMQLYVLCAVCLGVFMTSIDGTIITIALPSIKRELRFSDNSLVWIVNAYLVSYAGFRLIGGRLIDLSGPRSTFLWAITCFTLASLACSLANQPWILIVARGFQGLSGSLITAAALSLAVGTYADQATRSKAISFFGFIAASGGIIGLTLGGALTETFQWRSLFLINLPIGVIVYLFALRYLPSPPNHHSSIKVDVAGAALLITLPMALIYLILQRDLFDWHSQQVILTIFLVTLMVILFVRIESCASQPIVPLSIFRYRNLKISVFVSLLHSMASSATIFTSLYLQLVLKRAPMEASLVLLPSTVLITPLSLGLSAKIVCTFGPRLPLIGGLLLAAGGLLWLAHTSTSGSALHNVLPGTICFSLGSGLAFTPLMVAAVDSAAAGEIGLVSSISATVSIFGNALGLSILAAFAAARESYALRGGSELTAALNSGYHAAFFAAALLVLTAAVTSFFLLHTARTESIA